MPRTHFTCTATTKTGRDKCTPAECMKSCLNAQGCRPAPIAKMLHHNLASYENYGTISGSQLVTPCDGKNILSKILDYEQPLDVLYYASFRGSLVHDALERLCKGDPDLEGWMFEDRLFAYLNNDDEILPLEVPLKDGVEDWEAFAAICDELRADGNIILSGQVDSYDKENHVLVDYKTAKWVPTEPKEEWIAQLNFYKLLLELHGYPVKRIDVVAMDAGKQVIIPVPIVLDSWREGFLLPRIRELDALSRVDHVDDAWDYCTPGFLCNQKNRESKVYCPVASQCVVRQEMFGDLRPEK